MAEHSTIEWTDATWNPITGCSVVSPGCTNCYAMKLAGTRLQHHPSRTGLTTMSKAGPVWNGQVRFNLDWLLQPLQWKTPRKIFVCAHGDLFADGVPDAWIDQVFAVMALAPQHTFQVLTKRSGRMREYFESRSDARSPTGFQCPRINHILNVADRMARTDHPLAFRALAELLLAGKVTAHFPNVWLGTTTEDQQRADERRDDLAELAKQGWTTFVSYEPAIGPIDWSGWGFLSQLISGGESGSGARPSHPDWHRASRDFCDRHGIAYFFKQWGAWEVAVDRGRDDPDWRLDYTRKFGNHGNTKWINLAGGCGFHGDRFHVMRRVGKAAAGRLLDGIEHNGMPEVRE